MAITTALRKIEATLYEPTFYKVIQGGQSAGKTYAIMTLLVGYCDSYTGALVTVAGMTYDHLAKGVIRDLKSVLSEVGRWEDERWNETKKIYTFPNGSQLEFVSVDKMTSRGPRRDVLYVNEANGLSYEVFGHLANRTKDFVIIDYNPSAEFWAHTELVAKKPERTSFLILTYKDNEAISPQEKENIEDNMPKPGEEPSNWWVVYGLGQVGSLDGNIYSGWIEDTEEAIRERMEFVCYGLDFGFGHPTGMVAVYEGADGEVGVVEKIYERGISSSKYPAKLEEVGIDKAGLIVADSARPEIIHDIKAAGYRIIGANKNAGSVERGISRVQERLIYYCGKNLKREYLSYKWRTKADGTPIYEPVKEKDDLMDATRYAIDDLKRPRFDF